MEPVCNLPGTAKGHEVLYFPDAEVAKTKGSEKSFASFGGLSVLYFPSYNRFILQLNDWRYPLLRRLNINSAGNGSYNLPATNGFSFDLKINNSAGQSLQSFDSLLQGTRKLAASPEDKLFRQPKAQSKETGIKEVIGQNIKKAVQKVQNKAATLTTGTKHLTSTKKRINLKDIKTKNFRKEAHSKLNKDFFQSNEKQASDFLQRRRDLMSSSESRDFDALKKFSNGPTMYIPKEEIEEAILLGKDAFNLSSPMEPTNQQGQGKGLAESLKEGVQGLKDNLRGTDSRNAAPQVQAEKMPVSAEGMTHYQG